jgi:hypothetical protein
MTAGRLRGLCATNYIMALLFSGGLLWMMATEAPARESPLPTQATSSKETPMTIASEHAAEPDAGAGAGGDDAASSERPPRLSAKAAAPPPVRDRWQLPLVMALAGGLGGALCNLRGIFMYSSGEARARGRSLQDAPEFPETLLTPYYVRLAIGPCVGLAALLVASLAFTPFSESAAAVPGWDNLAIAYRYMGLAFLAGFASKEFMQALKNTAEGLFGQNSAVKNDTRPHTAESSGRNTPPAPVAPKV